MGRRSACEAAQSFHVKSVDGMQGVQLHIDQVYRWACAELESILYLSREGGFFLRAWTRYEVEELTMVSVRVPRRGTSGNVLFEILNFVESAYQYLDDRPLTER